MGCLRVMTTAALLLALFFLPSAFGEVSKSANFQIETAVTNEGAGMVTSASFAVTHSIGDATSSVPFTGLSFIARTGEQELVFGPLKGIPSELQITEVFAREAAAGAPITPATWQKDNDPYFYWDRPAHVSPEDIAGYSVSVDAEPDDRIDTTSTSYQMVNDALSDGTHTFYVKAGHTSGTFGPSTTFVIWVDTVPPAISGLAPTEGAVLNEPRPLIAATLTDAQSGIDTAAIVMNVNHVRVTPTFDAASGQAGYAPAGDLPQGPTSVSIEPSDRAGNTADPIIWSFTVDTRPPAGTLLINHGDSVTNSVYAELTLKAQDATSAVTEMMLSNDGVFDNETWEAYATRRARWALTPVSGLRTVFVRFRDAAGNISETASDAILLVLLSPDTLITSGPAGITAETSATFTYAASTAGAVFAYAFDLEDFSAWSSQTSVMRSGLTTGNHYFKVKAAKDVNGNGIIDPDEEDPTPAERVWRIGATGGILGKERPIKFWRVE